MQYKALWSIVGSCVLVATLLLAPTKNAFEFSCEVDADCKTNMRCLQSPKRCTPVLGEAPLPSLMWTATLGRKAAAADLVWMGIVQTVGSPYSHFSEYQNIEHWVFTFAELDGSESLPYFSGGILLSTYPDRAEVADKIFALGEKNAGESWDFAMWRAFVAYFSAFDTEKAADHYERAAALGAPAKFGLRAKKMRAQKLDCAEILKTLRKSQAELKNLAGADAMAKQGSELRVYVNCWEKSIDHMLQARRVRNLPAVETLQTLVDEGALQAIPPLPKGQCWSIIGGSAKVKPCTTSASSPNPTPSQPHHP
ncbi:MAG: hypothetical protein GY822_25390 [Deltaproteobacteria bacterium]|nr:hypothetical protein [Deltaproteobacteria bacterium]